MGTFSIRTQRFRLGKADYRTLYLAQTRRVLTTLPFAPLIFGLIIAVPVAINVHDLQTGHYQNYLLYQILVPASYVLMAARDMGDGWRRYARSPAMTGERIMIFDAGAVRLIGPGFDRRQAWALFTGIRQSRDRIFLCLRGYKVYAVPKSALAPADAQRLMSEGRAAIRAARKAPQALPPLPEPPESRALWRSHPFCMILDRPLGYHLKRLATIAAVVLAVALLAIAAYSWRFGPSSQGLLGSDGLRAILFILAIFFTPVFALTLGAWLALRRYPDRRGLRDVAFTRDYVRCTGATIDTRADWAAVEEVRRAPGTFVFRLAIGLVCLPASAFASPAQAEAFFTQAVAFWRAAQARRQFRP